MYSSGKATFMLYKRKFLWKPSLLIWEQELTVKVKLSIETKKRKKLFGYTQIMYKFGGVYI